MAKPMQSVDPTLLALQTAKTAAQNAKKNVLPSLSTQAIAKPSLNVQTQQPQAISTPPIAKIGGISSPFGAPNINSAPILGGATPTEIKDTATQLQSLPKAMPQTGSSMTIPKEEFKQKVIQAKQQGFTSTQILQRYKDKGYTIEGVNYDDFLEPVQGGGQIQGGGKAQFSPGGIEQFKPVMPTSSGAYNPLKTIANAPASFANVGVNLANMGLSPIETAKGLLKTIVGATNVVGSAIPKAILGDEKYNEVNQKLLNDQGTLGQIRRYASEGGEQAKAVGEYFKGYLDPEELQRRLEEDPAGILSDVATLMGFAGGAIQKAGQVSKLSKVAQVGQKIASLEKYDPYKFLPKATKEIGGKAISKVANIAGEGAVSLLGKATGTSADTIKEVYKAAAQGDTSAIEGIRGAINDETVIENLKRGVQDIIDDRKTMYGKGYEVLKSNLTNVDTTPIAKKTLESLSDMGINFDAQGNLDFAGSTITSPQARSNLQNIVSDLYTRGDNTPKGLDILKQRVADYARYTPEFAKSDRVATMVSNLIKDEIVKVVPEYAEMTKGYAELSNLVKDIKQATGMGRKENISTIGTKLKGLLRDNQEVRKMVVQKMQEATGRNVLGQVAGLQMQPIMPRGLMGVGIAGGVALGQISSLINPTYLIPLLATSPRLIGELANAMGVSTKFVTDYYNKFKSYASKYGNNTTNTMNNGGAMGNGLPNRVNEVKPSKGQTPTPPTPKTPPITVEKGAIGMGTPKPKSTAVLPPKTTVTPSVGEVKTTSNGVISNENKKILTDYLEKHEKARNNYIKSVYETYDGDTAKSYIKERDNKYGPKATQARDALGIKRTKKSSSDVQAESFFKGLQKEQGKTPPAPKATDNPIVKQAIKTPKVVTPPTPKNQPVMNLTNEAKPKVSDSLAQEARKYKTADEFIDGISENLAKKDIMSFDEFKKTNPNITLEKYNKIQEEMPFMLEKEGEFIKGVNQEQLDKIVDPGNNGRHYQLRKIRQDAQTTPPAPKGFKGLGKETMEQNITKADDSLIQEAKKYKSAEEFVNSKKIFHGTSKEKYANIQKEGWKTPNEVMKDGRFEVMMYEDHVSTTNDYKVAERYALRDPKGGKVVVLDNSDLKLLTDKKNIQMPDEEWGEYLQRLQKEGYDGIDGQLGHPNFIDYIGEKGKGDTEVLVWNVKKLKEMKAETESQLKQIREQANKKPLPPLPKKGLPKLPKGEVLEQDLYHGTRYKFDKFDLEKSFSDRNNTLGAGDAVYFSESKDIADKYTRANANEYLHKSVIDEVSDPNAKKLLKGLVDEGFDKGWGSMSKQEISNMNIKGIDGNDINDLSEWIRGSQSTKKEGANLLTMNNKVEIPDNILKIAKKLGIKTLPQKPNIITVSLKDNAKIKDIGQTSNIQKATEQAKKEGFDGIKFITSESIDNKPEVAVRNTSVIDKKPLPPLPKKGK